MLVDTLTTYNIPILGEFLNRLTDDVSPFHCEVYFINKTEQMAIRWGTDSKVEYMDPAYGFPIQIGASGEMNLACCDSRKLLVKIVGTENQLTQAGIVQKFRSFLMSKIKPYIAKIMREEKINIFSIDEQLLVFSQSLELQLVPDFLEYGINLVHFFVTTIVKPEDDRMYQKFKELHFRQYVDIAEAQLQQKIGMIDQQTTAQRMIIEAQGIAQKRSTEGYTYQDERRFDVSELVAQNEGVGEFTNMGIGLGMMGSVGTMVGGAVGGMMQGVGQNDGSLLKNTTIPQYPESKTVCIKCSSPLLAHAKFCLECGEKVEHQPLKTSICPQCTQATPNGKFCIGCGARLPLLCASCGVQIQCNSKFCQECGHKHIEL